MRNSLKGLRVVVTRAEEEGGPLSNALRRAGAEPIVAPLIAIDPIRQRDDEVPINVATFDWLIFTSANGVRMFVARLDADERSSFRNHRRIASVGPATARAVAESGGNSALIAPEFVAESLANALGEVAGKRLLWPRAAAARDVLTTMLRGRGAEVVERVLYDTIPLPVDDAARSDILHADAVTFTSPSSVRAFVALFGTAVQPRVACIGPVTALAAREAGLEVHAVAAVYTMDGLVAALADLPPVTCTAKALRFNRGHS